MNATPVRVEVEQDREAYIRGTGELEREVPGVTVSVWFTPEPEFAREALEHLRRAYEDVARAVRAYETP